MESFRGSVTPAWLRSCRPTPHLESLPIRRELFGWRRRDIQPSITCRAAMRTCRCSFAQLITPIVHTRAIAPTTAFPSAVPDRRMPCGRMRDRMRQSPEFTNTWRFIPHGSMRSKWSPKHVIPSAKRATVQANGPHGETCHRLKLPGSSCDVESADFHTVHIATLFASRKRCSSARDGTTLGAHGAYE